jgi:hypothetical protein
MRNSVLASLGMALVLMVVGGLGAHAQEATAVPSPMVPDPALFRAAPRSLTEIQTLLATPIPAAAQAPFVEPIGTPADAQTAAAVTETALEIVACGNAGNFLALTALYTGDYLRGQLGGQPLDDATAALFAATPVAFPPEQRAKLVAVRNISVLAVRRVGVFIDLDDPNGPPEGTETEYGYFVAAGDRYLVDEIVVIEPASGATDATPAP